MNLAEKWNELANDYEAANKANMDAWMVVYKKQRAIADGVSEQNPTEDELNAWDEASAKCEIIKNMMNDFIEQYRHG